MLSPCFRAPQNCRGGRRTRSWTSTTAAPDNIRGGSRQLSWWHQTTFVVALDNLRGGTRQHSWWHQTTFVVALDNIRGGTRQHSWWHQTSLLFLAPPPPCLPPHTLVWRPFAPGCSVPSHPGVAPSCTRVPSSLSSSPSGSRWRTRNTHAKQNWRYYGIMCGNAISQGGQQ